MNDEPPPKYTSVIENDNFGFNNELAQTAPTVINTVDSNTNDLNMREVNNTTINGANRVSVLEPTVIQTQEDYRQKFLDKSYPVKFSIVHAVIIAAVSLTLIALQITMIVNQINNNFYCGIWVGFYFLIISFLEVIISKYLKFIANLGAKFIFKITSFNF